jgi:hypothetical protein
LISDFPVEKLARRLAVEEKSPRRGIRRLATVGATVVVGIPQRDPRVLGPMLRWQGDHVNPRVLRTAGRAGDPHSVIRHVGRTSGREYATF